MCEGGVTTRARATNLAEDVVEGRLAEAIILKPQTPSLGFYAHVRLGQPHIRQRHEKVQVP